MHGRDGPPIELVEAPVVGRRAGIVAIEMPLVDKAGAIASRAEHGGDGSIFRQQVDASHISSVAPRIDFHAPYATSLTLVVADAGVTCILTRHERASRGRADAAAGITLCEACARFGQPVDIGCLDMFAAVARQVAIAHVIGQNKDDVRALWRCFLLVAASLYSLWHHHTSCQQTAVSDDFLHRVCSLLRLQRYDNF